MKFRVFIPFAALCVFFATAHLSSTRMLASDRPQWRWPQRNGISPERGLLKQWPQEGPKLLRRQNDIGVNLKRATEK